MHWATNHYSNAVSQELESLLAKLKRSAVDIRDMLICWS